MKSKPGRGHSALDSRTRGSPGYLFPGFDSSGLASLKVNNPEG